MIGVAAAAAAVVSLYCDLETTKTDSEYNWYPSLEITKKEAPAQRGQAIFTINFDKRELFVKEGPKAGSVIPLTDVTSTKVSINSTSGSMPTVGIEKRWELTLSRESGHVLIVDETEFKSRGRTLSNSQGLHSGYCKPGKLVPFPQAQF